MCSCLAPASFTLKTPGRVAISASGKYKGHAVLGFYYFPICSDRPRYPSRLQVLNLLTFFTIFPKVSWGWRDWKLIDPNRHLHRVPILIREEWGWNMAICFLQWGPFSNTIFLQLFKVAVMVPKIMINNTLSPRLCLLQW